MKRETGYYWVKFKSEDKYRIAYFEVDTERWFYLGYVWRDDDHLFTEIDERRIEKTTILTP